ncbi:alpha-crystallin B chain-like [Liolophura sinensis]|uniref:alpha-crystallin B chain-like n=1 Tax=Liolophura sinensis TaxID=3198878 RepID=UPI0031593BED
MALSRYVPISFEDERDLWRPNLSLEPSWISPQYNRWSLDRSPRFQPHHQHHTDLVPFSNQRLAPIRDFDQELRQLSNNMSRMYQDMLTLVPSKALPTDIHMNEELRMDNPIVTDMNGKKKFQLQFDVRQFRPEEISLTTSDNILTVHACHEEKSEGKSAFREYKRQYTIPPVVSAQALTSKLSHNGILSIEAPVHMSDTMIPIKHQ